MALSENNSKPPEKPHTSNKYDPKKLPTKVVIRRLPPSMTQEEFLNQVSPVPDYDYIYSVRGDKSLAEHSFSRVYINFCNAQDIYIFKEKFDNYVFVDNKGHEYPAVVEYAAFQKVLRRRRPRTDHKKNTIDTDPVYLEFLESLKAQPSHDEKPEFSFQPLPVNKPTEITTPLLDYLKQRKIDRLRIKEEKREERRKREVEKKKLREDDRRKRFDDKQTGKPFNRTLAVKEHVEAPKPILITRAKQEGNEEESYGRDKYYDKYAKFKDRRYEDRKPKPRFNKYDNKYEDKREYKLAKRDDYYPKKQEEPKRFEPTENSKKIKKYSEKREERRNENLREAKKAEEKVLAKPEKPEKQQGENKEKNKDIKVEVKETVKECTEKVERKDSIDKEDNRRLQDDVGDVKDKDKLPKRIRNKDRPTMLLYKPGMLRKKSIEHKETDFKEEEKPKEKPSEE